VCDHKLDAIRDHGQAVRVMRAFDALCLNAPSLPHLIRFSVQSVSRHSCGSSAAHETE
jgi:hypothetical protein